MKGRRGSKILLRSTNQHEKENGHKLKQTNMKFHLNKGILFLFFSVKVVNFNRFPREAVEFLSVEIVKMQLVMILGNQIYQTLLVH